MKTRLEWIEIFTADMEYVKYNVAHLVLSDGNIENHNIKFTIKWIDAHRKEYLHDNLGEVYDTDIDYVRAFLEFLLSIPYYDDEDETE